MSDHIISTESAARAAGGTRSTLVGLFVRPRVVVYSLTGLAAVGGWSVLLAMAAELGTRGGAFTAGPGMGWFDSLAVWLGLADGWWPALRALCTAAGLTTGPVAGPAAPDVVSLLAVLAMWGAMAAAMMLPSAAPMFTTYGDIAEAAAERDAPAVSPVFLIAGYMSVWAVFCVAATGLQLVLARLALLTGSLAPASPYLAGGALAAAGLYQFTHLKHACLNKCRTPFPFFFANWTIRRTGIFRLGIQQGVNCLLCCWALMLVTFAAGLMNVVWMALLAIVMVLEKSIPNPRPVIVLSGAGLVIWAALLIGSGAGLL